MQVAYRITKLDLQTMRIGWVISFTIDGVGGVVIKEVCAAGEKPRSRKLIERMQVAVSKQDIDAFERELVDVLHAPVHDIVCVDGNGDTGTVKYFPDDFIRDHYEVAPGTLSANSKMVDSVVSDFLWNAAGLRIR